VIKLDTFASRQNLSIQMQPIAIEKVYRRLWPNADIHEVDLSRETLACSIDRIGNADKVVVTEQTVLLLAQRIRQANVWLDGRYRDFTLRWAEVQRLQNAYESGGALPNYYAYGYATATLDDFLRFYVLRFPEWWEYSQQSWIPTAHKLQLKDMKGRQESFWYVAFANIPERFIIARYVFGLPNTIQPVERRKTRIAIQTQLAFDF
jgi:hypothetical protein